MVACVYTSCLLFLLFAVSFTSCATICHANQNCQPYSRNQYEDKYVIDPFDDYALIKLPKSAPPEFFDSYFANGTDIVGGARTLKLAVTQGSKNLPFTAEVSNGEFVYLNPSGGSSFCDLQYDGLWFDGGFLNLT